MSSSRLNTKEKALLDGVRQLREGGRFVSITLCDSKCDPRPRPARRRSLRALAGSVAGKSLGTASLYTVEDCQRRLIQNTRNGRFDRRPVPVAKDELESSAQRRRRIGMPDCGVELTTGRGTKGEGGGHALWRRNAEHADSKLHRCSRNSGDEVSEPRPREVGSGEVDEVALEVMEHRIEVNGVPRAGTVDDTG